MAVAVGTDLVHIPRLARNLGRDSFLARAFTVAELEFCAGRADRLAARWAAKEAAMKAMGKGVGEVRMTDVEVTVEPSGRPQLIFHGRAEELVRAAAWRSWSLSLSHDGDYATAVLVAES